MSEYMNGLCPSSSPGTAETGGDHFGAAVFLLTHSTRGPSMSMCQCVCLRVHA